jgi:co-chaperonin GroES (HSP10)
MKINSQYIVVTKQEEPPKEGYQTVAIQDSFVYKGIVKLLPEAPQYVDNHQLAVGDTVMFAKYSPDTHEMDLENDKVKFVKTSDVLAVI